MSSWIALIVDYHVYAGLLLYLRRKRFKTRKGPTNQEPEPLDFIEQANIDEDVIAERERIEAIEFKDILKVDKLVKVYVKKDENPSEEVQTQINERPEDDYANKYLNKGKKEKE